MTSPSEFDSNNRSPFEIRNDVWSQVVPTTEKAHVVARKYTGEAVKMILKSHVQVGEKALGQNSEGSQLLLSLQHEIDT